MVVTMLPTYAITAAADQTVYGNGVYSEYMTDSTKTGMSGTATWDSTMNAWSFNGSQYLKLDGSPLANVTTSSGFAISFEVYNTDNSLANKYFSFNNGSARISMDGSSPDWWTRYRTEISNGTNTRGYYTSDFTSGDYCSTVASANGNDSYPTGAWHTMTVVMNSDGSYSYYRNGDLLATFKSNYISTGNGGGLSDANAASAISGATNYIVGATNTSGSEGFTGYMRNFRVISNVSSGTAGSLAVLICRYEAKLRDGSIHKNTLNAYKAYIDACEAYDAALYGNSSTAQISAAYSALNTAIGNMTEFTKPTANAVQSYQANASDSGVDRAASNSVNIISSNRNSTSGQTTAASQEVANCSVKVFYGENVLLYDGETQPRFPVTFSCVRTSNKTRYVHTIYPASSDGSKSSSSNGSTDFDLHHDKDTTHANCWYGSDTNNNRIDYGYNFTLTEKVGGNATNSDNHWSAKLNNSTTHYYVSAARYIGTPDAAIKDFTIKWSQRSSSNEQVSGSSITNDDYGTMTSSVHTYVYNYGGIKSRIESKATYYTNVQNYKEGGLATIFGYMDTLTRDWSTIMGDMSNSNTAYSSLNSATPTADSKNYDSLRNAIDLYAAPTGTAGSAVDGIKYSVRQLIADNGYVDTDNNGTKDTQLTGFSDFQSAYNDAKGVMAALGGSGLNTNSTSNYTDSTAAAKATALINAFNALNLVTLTPPTVNINNGTGGGAYIGKTNGFTLTNNDGKTPQYSVRYSTDGGSSWGAWSEYANYSAEVKPFSSLADTADKNNWAEYKTRSTDGNGHYSDESSATQVKFLSAPTLASSTNSDELGTADTVTLTTTNDSAGTLQYSYNNTSWTDYSAAIAPFTANSTVSQITVYSREKKGTSYSPVTSATYNKSVLAPTFSEENDAYIEANTSVTISNNSGNTETGNVTLEYHYDSAGYTSYLGALTPFSGTAEDAGAASKTIHAKATRNGKTAESSITVHYLSRPEMNIANNASINATTPMTVTQTSGLDGNLEIKVGGMSWRDYNGQFNPFSGTNYTQMLVKARQKYENGSTTYYSPELSVMVYKIPNAPSYVSDGEYLDKTHGITASLNDGTDDTASTLQYKIGSGEWTTYNGKIYPFSGKGDGDATETVVVSFRASRKIGDVTSNSPEVSTTVKYLARPTLSFSGTAIANNQEFYDYNNISVDSGVNNAGVRKYYISDDNGSTWKEFTYSTSFAPFGMSGTDDNSVSYDFTDDVTLKIKAKEFYAASGSVSAETETYTILLKKLSPLTIYYKPDSSAVQDTRYYRPNGAIYINTEGYTGKTVYYQTNVDGAGWGTLSPYSINAGIDSDSFPTATVVQFKFFVVNNSGVSAFAEGALLNEEIFSDFVFRESFDDSSISGTTLTFSNDATATLSSSGTASIVEGAGWKDSNGNSPDWRNNVLKINANGTKPGNYIQFTQNPLAAGANAPAANVIGATISFWRYLEKNGSCADISTNDGDPTGYIWRNAIAFDDGNASNGQGFYLIEANGVNSFCTTSGTNYVDYAQENQDPTGHAAGNHRGHWVNVVITIDPNNGVTLYTNGEPHNMKAGFPKKMGIYSSMTDAEVAQEILKLITSSNMYFNYGDNYEGNDYDMYLDDIRIYTGVKTQVEINNMYIDSDADVQSDLTSTAHDPTNVTVYTLAHSVTYTAYDENNASKSVTLAAGTTVGQEVIDYCELNPRVGAGDVTAIDEYSFGTGMTIYHRNKTTKKWEVVGDDAGRCGYQNQKLFGAEYHTALAEPLAHAATSGNTGAGHLLWAPHVMFNLYNGTWTYYGSTSSWSSTTSAIFVCDAAAGGSVEGPYTYRQIVYKSTGAPNAIDACCYYAYDSSGKPITKNVYMAFGSWGGTNCIALKTLYADGDGYIYDTAFDNVYLCNGINGSLEGVEGGDNGSGEGAYVIYDNGYYYLYISYGQNTGSYVERVYRSTSPTSGFVGCNGVLALDTSTSATHGGQILAPFDLSNHDYLMVSTGHNSVYKTVNDKGEIVTLNSVHARPYANEAHGWQALPDGALATRQSGVTGNVNMVNQVAYTKQGWPVLMPFQYDGSDTIEFGADEIKAENIEGVYGANDLQNTVYYDHADEYIYTIIKDDTDDMLAYEYGTDGSGSPFKDYIVLEKQATSSGKYIYYARYYASNDFDIANKRPRAGRDPLYEGVIGKHGSQIGISMICTSDYEYTWTYRIKPIPTNEDVDSLGDSVSMDGIIYTHKTNDSYAKYGREISDDFQYGTSDLHQGERCTTITTTYPAMIDLSNPAAIYCQSDEKFCRDGNYVGGDFSATPLKNNKWFDAAGNQYTDSEAVARNGIGTGGASDKLKRRYGLTGFVSDYYFNTSTGEFMDKGVTLIISYVDVATEREYSEFEFCYVMANPAMAHTIQGIRNQHKDWSGYKDIRAGIILFDRFIGSSGQATTIESAKVWNKRTSPSAEKHSKGTYKFLDTFGSDASTGFDYSSPDKTAGAFDDFDSNVGVNSGSYGLIEHDNDALTSYTVSSSVVDADYYIDYSNTDNYDINNQYGTITTSDGVPTGYKFRFRTSNIKWAATNDKRWNATSYMLLTGDLKRKVTTNSTYNSSIDSYVDQNSSGNEGKYTYGNYTDDERSALGLSDVFKISGLGSKSTNSQKRSTATYGDTDNKYTLGLNNDGDEGGRMVMSGYYYDPSAYIASVSGATSDNIRTQSDYYCYGLTRALPLIDTGLADTNRWNMHIDFTGTQTVKKNTDTASAETYANFIIEQGIGVFSYGVTDKYANTEETYAYYNIGVHTCDKGAARAFADNYLRKRLAVTDNGDGSVTVKTNPTTGAPIYLKSDGITETTNVDEAGYINPQDYTLSSYQDYIDAVSELNWFVENPTKTTLYDYDDSLSKNDFTTAYTSDGDPIYITSTKGRNILRNNNNTNTDSVQAQLIQNVIIAYQNLFKEVDYTNAETLYNKIDLLHDGEETITIADVNQIKITPAPGEEGTVKTYSKDDFTDDSWAAFVNLVSAVSSAFEYKAGEGVNPRDKDSWRHVELSGEEYRNLYKILQTVELSLLPSVNIAPLTTTYGTKHGSDSAGSVTGTVTGGIFTSTAKTIDGTSFAAGDQVYTFPSWSALNSKCIEANALIDDEAATYAPAQTETVDGDDIVNKGEDESDITYTKGMYEVTGITKYTFSNVVFYARNIDTSTLSDIQTEVNDVYDELSDLSLTLVDNPECYVTYDNAKTVIDSLDIDKYTDNPSENQAEWGGKQIIENASETTFDTVYSVLTAAQATAYNTAMGSTVVSAGDRLKSTTKNATDPQSYTLLEAVNTVNTTKVGGSGSDKDDYKYIKYFRIKADEQNAKTETVIGLLDGKKMYGEPVTVDVEDGNIVNWSISIYDGLYADGFGAKPRSSQKISGVSGSSLTRIANNNMAIVAEIEPDSAGGSIQYNILNCYGQLFDVMYGSSLTRNGTPITASTVIDNTDYDLYVDSDKVTMKVVPFYNLTGWQITKKSDTLYVLKPVYSVEDKYTINVIDDGTTTFNNIQYDKRFTLTVSDANRDNFVAWAAKTSAGKYQIASYSSTYYFFACANETYVPILNVGTDESPSYETAEGTPITASNIDGAITQTGSISADDFVKMKIKEHYPFVSIQNAVMSNRQVPTNGGAEKYTKARVFVRVTQGSDSKLSSYGVLYYNGNNNAEGMVIDGTGVYRRAVSNKLDDTGQFTYTLSNTKKGFSNNVSFRAYVNYDFTYAAGGNTASINGLDYSGVSIAEV